MTNSIPNQTLGLAGVGRRGIGITSLVWRRFSAFFPFKMKGFPREVFFSLILLFIGKIFDSVSRCDAERSGIAANSMKVMYACEDQMMHLICPHRSLSVKILSAKYGRLLTKKNICPGTMPSQVIKDCGEDNVRSNVDKLCAGKTECSFSVDNRNLGAYCINVYKYIAVVFKCVVRPTTKEPPTTTPMPTTTPITTTFIPTEQPNTNLSTTNVTNNGTRNTSEPNTSIKPTEASQKTIKITPKSKKPVIEVYDRDVFSRSRGTVSTLSSGHHSISRIVLSLLVFIMFDAYIFRVT